MTVSYRVKLLASHAAVALVVGVVTLVLVERQVTQRMEHQLDHRLEAQARAVAQWMERAAHPQHLARRLAGVVDARVTILDKSGAAVGDANPEDTTRPVADSGMPPEVSAARGGQVGRETRFSAADGQPVRYVAVAAPEEVVVRLGVPIGELDAIKTELRGQLIFAALGSLVVALGLAALVAGPLTRRLREVTAAAHRIGARDYDLPAPPTEHDEIGILARALAAAGAELRDNEQRRRAFLANVAHEIRTPVTSIRGYAAILCRDATVDPSTRHEFLETIHRNAIRIGTLVEDLLELEALEAKAAPLAREAVAIAPVVGHVVDTLKARATETGAAFAVDVPPALRMQGDADAIERIVLNLAENALRHGGPGVQVTIEARPTGDRARLVVRDTGPGVPAEHRARIFERFERGDAGNDGDRKGTGLGLSIARELAHAMGGSLALGDGSTFVLELPA